MDTLHATLKWIDHNRYLATGITLATLLIFGLAACAPKTGSLIYPGEKVTSAQLDVEIVRVETDLAKQANEITRLSEDHNAEIIAANKSIETARADIQRQSEMRLKLVEIAGALGTAAATGTINPAAGLAAGLQVLTLLAGAGAVADNRRKDKKLKAAKA